MVKNLLSLALLSSMAVGAHAYDVDNFIYTRAAKYKVTAANLVKNGELKGSSLEGWTATDATTASLSDVFTVKEEGGVVVNAGMTDLKNGMYQVINIEAGGTYVVTMKVKGAEAGFTDLDQTAAGTNYIFAYYNTDGTLSTVDGTNLLFGEGGAAVENCFSFTNEDVTEMSFPVVAPAEGKIVIDLRGMAAGVEVTDVECHAVTEVTDERVAQARLDWVNYILNGFEWNENYEFYNDVKADVAALEKAIKENGDITTMLENLEGDFTSFAGANLSNVFNTIEGDGTRDPSANWMNWVYKYNKLNSEYIGNSGWTWTTDRWAHKTAAADTPLQIQWMRGTAGPYDNIATLKTTLDKGTYFFGVDGQGGMMTLNKNRWMRHSGYECAETQLFLGVDGAATASDTINCGVLPTNAYKSYISKYSIAEDQTTVNVGIRCNETLAATNGFDVFFSNPVLYKVLVKGELTPEQKAYLATVETQIAALEGRIQVAEELVAATQTEKPWGKENLQKGIDAVKARLDAWKKYDQDALLELMDEGEAKYEATAALFYVENEYVAKDSVYTYETLGNVIMNAGVRYLNNEFINVFNNLNVPLTDMPAAIEAAKSVLGERIFTSSSKKGALTAKIADVEALYKAKLAAPYSAENAEALVNAKAELAQMVEDFKAAIASDVLVDIDFDGASFVKHENPNGEEDTYYTLAGKKGEMKFKEVAEALGTTLYELGYRASEEAEVDSVGMLRVGSGSANVAFAAIPESTDNIVRVSFDLYFGNLITKSAGYYITAENGDTICGLVCSKYSGTSLINTHEVDFNGKINAVGSSAASNAAIAATSNATHFDIVLDYGLHSMYTTTSGSKGTATTDAVDLDETKKVAGFILTSDYNNSDRRSWFDNLKVEVISATPATGIKDVNAVANMVAKTVKMMKNGQLVIKSAKGTFNAVGVQVK